LNVKLQSQGSTSLKTKAGNVTVQGSNANVSHTLNEDERAEFTNHINMVRRAIFIRYIVTLTTLKVIENDPDVGNRYPIPTDTMQLFECKDGLILCKLINDSVADTIDTRVLNKPQPRKPLNAFQITENNIVITVTSYWMFHGQHRIY
jgi:plastin-1